MRRDERRALRDGQCPSLVSARRCKGSWACIARALEGLIGDRDLGKDHHTQGVSLLASGRGDIFLARRETILAAWPGGEAVARARQGLWVNHLAGRGPLIARPEGQMN